MFQTDVKKKDNEKDCQDAYTTDDPTGTDNCQRARRDGKGGHQEIQGARRISQTFISNNIRTVMDCLAKMDADDLLYSAAVQIMEKNQLNGANNASLLNKVPR